ncbi:hypothetical protein KSP39_PZI001064 [Platanthera zijinensis]|uniref:AT3G52170-like helix-turn-helix domain-containing protein n=1 Tax=Platanthera zijinensis TaxID=2320716 RepID=A0AAP0C662_9ASPA
MQGVTVRWVGQSFTLHRCSASSSEKKIRTQRTKDERRAMAEAFIKKYQGSNEGNFPSHNLTHKEVGGSFYTILEIVRDIIQENKVWGTENPSSKILNLEYYLYKEEDNGLFLDVQGNIFVSTVVNEKDQVLHEVVSSMEDH